MNQKRRIAIMIGSDSDLPLCREGLSYLQQQHNAGVIEVTSVYTCSIHRHTEEVLRILREEIVGHVDILIAGAGMANHLTGTCDAYLRNTLGDTSVVVIGVAFGSSQNLKGVKAAINSIVYVPDTQTVFHDYVAINAPGSVDGFLAACVHAVRASFAAITLQTVKPPRYRTLDQALEAIITSKAKG